MKTKTQTVLPTGILAGIAATVLTLGAYAQMQSFLAVILYAASALPVLIAGLGWGNRAAAIAVVTAAVLGAVLASPYFAAVMAISTLAPAGWLSHLANLARPASELGGPDDLMAWYPISDILLHLCAVITASLVILGVMIGYGPELIDETFSRIADAMRAQQPDATIDAAAMAQLKTAFVTLVPMTQGAMWVMLLFAVFYLAVRMVSRSGRAVRPREDMPSALRMNRHAIFVFLGGIVLMFIDGVPAMIGATICGTFGAGFLLAGFASLHFRSQGKDWRLPVLVLCYLAATLVLPAMIILVLGLADTRRTIALTPLKSSPNPDETKID